MKIFTVILVLTIISFGVTTPSINAEDIVKADVVQLGHPVYLDSNVPRRIVSKNSPADDGSTTRENQRPQMA
nr:13057_t:CDS:2 [Entrophospora candida]